MDVNTPPPRTPSPNAAPSLREPPPHRPAARSPDAASASPPATAPSNLFVPEIGSVENEPYDKSVFEEAAQRISERRDLTPAQKEAEYDALADLEVEKINESAAASPAPETPPPPRP